jgi:RNA 3'-terminal phosphate cyclase (ATP)
VEHPVQTNPVQIDGSQGEGGGQILRSALALSCATGRPFRISGIRAGRPKPGLMRQHLTCVQAAREICSGAVSGAHLGSQEIEFRPGPVRGGSFTFSVGTAGSTTLVLQAVLPPLLTAPSRSVLVVEGGTHAKAAPPFEFFERALVPLLNRMGPRVTARLDRHGFYPAGGGRVTVEIDPCSSLTPLEIHGRGEARERTARVLLSRLAFSIAEREMEIIRGQLNWDVGPPNIVIPDPAFGPGNAVVLEVAWEHITEVFSGIGEIGKSAERVAVEAVTEAREYLAAGVPVARHLADQLMVPLALAGCGSFTTLSLSEHSRTNEAVIRAFLPVVITSEGVRKVRWSVRTG